MIFSRSHSELDRGAAALCRERLWLCFLPDTDAVEYGILQWGATLSLGEREKANATDP